ncbi:MAG TPA: hypothetical protein VKM72_31190 [Thermoanaerobaculia bacterium]|nr:hypothetical protein [Thermoanaerobaculia bacterium]
MIKKWQIPALLLLLAGSLPALAQEEDAERIQFQKGKSSAELRGTIKIQQVDEWETDTYLPEGERRPADDRPLHQPGARGGLRGRLSRQRLD